MSLEPERYEQIGQLYHAALERERAERASFLLEACRDDELPREGRITYRLLRAGRKLHRPAARRRCAGWQAAANSPGLSFAHYEIVSLLGKGGMGDVWLAEDTQLGRKVAVKLLPEFTTDAARVWRFAQEARSASSLNHPNILRGDLSWVVEKGHRCLHLMFHGSHGCCFNSNLTVYEPPSALKSISIWCFFLKAASLRSSELSLNSLADPIRSSKSGGKTRSCRAFSKPSFRVLMRAGSACARS